MSYEFVNPYSFFPLSEKKQVAEEPVGKRLSGVICYRIQTRTPLFIPDSEKTFIEKTEDGKNHPHSVFMSLNNLKNLKGDVSELGSEEIRKPQVPFIPGSSVRGLFRSVYEMLTDSCLSTLNDDDLLSKRTHEVFCAGLLQKTPDGKFMLYKADDCIFRAESTGSIADAPSSAYRTNPSTGIREYIDFDTKSYRIDRRGFTDGKRVYIQTKPRTRGKTIAKNLSLQQSTDSPVEGYLMNGLDGPKMDSNPKAEKHNCHIFVLDSTSSAFEVNIKILDDILQIYKDHGINVYSEYAKEFAAFKKAESGAYFPVYYSKLDATNTTYLSPAAITREIYSRRIKDSVNGMTPCNDTDQLCSSCRLFGTIEPKTAVASQLRFSDLSFAGSELGDIPAYTEPKRLIPLSAPKISNMEFYLQRPAPNAVFWTYDYYIDDKGNVHANTSVINGRKFYWNHDGQVLTTDLKSDQNKTVYPLDRGNVFVGKVYFDRISQTELENLIYILNCGEKEQTAIADRTHCYKLGSAKPAGLGSISVKVDNVLVRDFSSDGTYSISPYTSTGTHKLRHLPQFAAMTGFVKETIDYPRLTAGGDIFAWYSNNHKGYRFDRRQNKNMMTNSPNSRKQEFFGEYLVPLQTKLKVIPLPQPNAQAQTPTCRACGRPTGTNPNTGRAFPLCQQCNNDKVPVICSKCGEKFVTPRYFAEKTSPVCMKCRNLR